MQRLIPLLLATLLLPQARAASPGLSVQNGDVMKDGRRYRGIGANYFSLFSRVLSDPKDTSSLSNLAALAHAGVPFARFMCGGFWPIEQRLYLTNREAFLQRLDLVVRCAETNGIGLVPSLFWNVSTAPDLVGEHLDEYGNPKSKTIALVRRYTADIVGRYKDSPAIWGWEFGNEYNLDCDLPNASEHRPAAWPDLGATNPRTERDELKFTQVRVAFVAFAETIRSIDRTRLIFSGNAIPRASAWHNVKERKWTADTEPQFAEILARDNPDPMNTISVHLYPERKGGYSGGAKTMAEAVAVANRQAQAAVKPLCIGEFGAPRKLGTRDEQRAAFEDILRAIVKEKVPLAAFWVYDYGSQDTEWNISLHNDRAYMIDLVVKANKQLKAQ